MDESYILCFNIVGVGGNVFLLHQFEACAGFEAEEVGLEASFGIGVFGVGTAVKVCLVKGAHGFKLVCPDGDVFDFHKIVYRRGAEGAEGKEW